MSAINAEQRGRRPLLLYRFPMGVGEMQTFSSDQVKDKPKGVGKPDLLFILAAAVLLLFCLYITHRYSLYWALARLHRYAIEYEGHVFWACLSLSQGANIYGLTSLTAEPRSVVIYNPLFFLFGAFLFKIFGACFAPLRILSMVSALACFLGLASLLKLTKTRPFVILLTVAGFASLLPVVHWSTVARVDFLGLALAVWSLHRFALFFAGRDSPSERFPLASLLLSLLAFFCKQQYFVFMLACVLFAYLSGRKKLAIAYLTGWFVSALVLALLIQSFTGGYFAHLAYAAGLPWQWDTLKLFIIPFLLDPKTIFALFVILKARAKATLPFQAASADQPSFWLLAFLLFLFSLSLAMYTMGLRGAFHNHLLCSEFALFWLAALSLNRLPFKFAIMSLVAAILGITPMLQFGRDLVYRTDSSEATERTVQLLRKISDKNPLILSEDPSLAIFAGAVPMEIDATTFLNIAEVRGGKHQGIIRAISAKHYGAVVINTHDAEEHCGNIWPAKVVEAINKNYSLAGKSGGNGMRQSVFLPRQ